MPDNRMFVEQHIKQLCATYEYSRSLYQTDPILTRINSYYLDPGPIMQAVLHGYSEGPSKQHSNTGYALSIYDNVLQQAICGKMEILLNRRLINAKIENQLSLQKCLLAYYNFSDIANEAFCRMLKIQKDSYRINSLINITSVPTLSYNDWLDVLFVPLLSIYKPEESFFILLHEIAHIIFCKDRGILSQRGFNVDQEIINMQTRFQSPSETTESFCNNIFAELFSDILVYSFLRCIRNEAAMNAYHAFLIAAINEARQDESFDVVSKILALHRLRNYPDVEHLREHAELFAEIQAQGHEGIIAATTSMRTLIEEYFADKAFFKGALGQVEDSIQSTINQCMAMCYNTSLTGQDIFSQRIELYRRLSENPAMP